MPAHRRCSINGWNEKQTSIVQGQGPAPCGLSRSGLWMIKYHSAQKRPWNLPLVTAGDTEAQAQGEGYAKGANAGLPTSAAS